MIKLNPAVCQLSGILSLLHSFFAERFYKFSDLFFIFCFGICLGIKFEFVRSVEGNSGRNRCSVLSDEESFQFSRIDLVATEYCHFPSVLNIQKKAHLNFRRAFNVKSVFPFKR